MHFNNAPPYVLNLVPTVVVFFGIYLREVADNDCFVANGLLDWAEALSHCCSKLYAGSAIAHARAPFWRSSRPVSG